MFPVLFSIGPLTLHTYGLFIAIAIVAGILITIPTGKSYGMTAQQIIDMGFIMILSGIIGSRLVYILINFSYYISHPLDIFKIWQGGLVFSGALIAVILVITWYVWRSNYTLWQIGDLWAPAAAIGQGIGRIGCFMAGCCYGKPTDVAWGVVFTDPQSIATLNIPLHPTQLYSSLSGFIIFFVLMILKAKKKFDGQVLLWFMILHSTSRLYIERFRGDDRGLIMNDWSVTQLLTIIILIASVVMLIILKSMYEKKIVNDEAPK
jgi:phosphatidylglycerol:prolipoprotein diacylglycerol transferase